MPDIYLLNLFDISLPISYIILYALAVSMCVYMGTKTSALAVVFLSMMILPAWVDDYEVWDSAKNMLSYDCLCLALMFFLSSASKNKYFTVFMFLTLLMIINGAIYLQFPFGEFYRKNILNILFASQCIITIRASYNLDQAVKLKQYQKRLKHGFFNTFEVNITNYSKTVL